MPRASELKITMSGRNVGKSIWTNKAVERLMKDLMNRPVEDLILNEGRIHGAKYHTVEPVGGNWVAMEAWCIQTFGEPGEIWPKEEFGWPDNMRWCMNNRKFWFRDEQDRDWFLIRWNA